MISVVIPAYNSEATIKECIEGVLNQTRIDLIDEIIVVDDGSTDNTVSIVKNVFDNQLVKVISKKNGGVSIARNVGIKEARGRWIALLDSDDVWKPQKIEKQVEAIESHPEIKFIGANRNNENVKFGKHISGNLYMLRLRDLLLKNWPHTSTALIECSVLKEVGLFNESMKYAEDGNLWNRIVVKYPLYYIAESLEIAGGGKAQYGESGLSSNLQGMYEGNVYNLIELKDNAYINIAEYYLWRILFWAKHEKRVILTNLRRRK